MAEKQLSEKELLEREEKLKNEIKKFNDTVISVKKELSKAKEKLAEDANKQRLDLEKELSETRIQRLAAVTEECIKYQQEQCEKLKSSLKSITEERQKAIEANTTLVTELQNKLEESVAKSIEQEAEIKTLKSRVNSKDASIKNLENEIEILQKTNKDINSELSEKKKECEDKKNALNDRAMHIAVLKKTEEDLRSSLEKTLNKISDCEIWQGKCNQLEENNKNLQKEIKSYEAITSIVGERNIEDLISELSSLNKSKENLKREKTELSTQKDELEFEKELLKKRKEEFSEKALNIKIEEGIKVRYGDVLKEKEDFIESLNKRVERLRNECNSTRDLLNAYKDFTAMFKGENPAEILLNYEKLKSELSEALDKLRGVPSEFLQKEYSDLKKDKDRLLDEKRELDEKLKEYTLKENEKAELQTRNAVLVKEKDSLIQHNNFLQKENDRLTASYDTPIAEEERIKEINKPYFTERLQRSTELQSEQDFLKNISNGLKEYGMEFPRRLLYSFHTALKTAEMSPLTVLSGVSGTGKSQLPRLYSQFGGLNFLSVPVAPNWDCQEAMLGYYNSIDNCFEAQSILRFLAQTQRNSNDSNGFDDVMNLILLDEMNLANVELYFSDFLSKLEDRRNFRDEDKKLPFINVKIGSKMNDWKLSLKRNVLWCGTMNQDETTKTLSDKVIDRGIILNFPTPKKLISRGDSYLNTTEPPLLLKRTWESWKKVEKPSEFNEILKPYKKQIENINEKLNCVGRALGHRVWQSIESYVTLHPDVKYAGNDSGKEEAVKIAFEDQLVQKVMPKLRGLENRGEQGKVLDGIKEIIKDYSIINDFEKAQNQGYGQFMWCSADYIFSTQKECVTETGESQKRLTDVEIQKLAEKYKDRENRVLDFTNSLTSRGYSKDEATKTVNEFYGKKN